MSYSILSRKARETPRHGGSYVEYHVSHTACGLEIAKHQEWDGVASDGRECVAEPDSITCVPCWRALEKMNDWTPLVLDDYPHA